MVATIATASPLDIDDCFPDPDDAEEPAAYVEAAKLKEPEPVTAVPQAEYTAAEQATTFGLKPLSRLSIEFAAHDPKGELPANVAADRFAQENRLASAVGAGRYWAMTNYHWDAPLLCHEPLLFEQLNAERYGITYGWMQPIVSGAHFFVTVPALPYKIVAQGHCPQYTLGYYRPGSCARPQCYKPNISAKAGLFEAGVILGMIFILP
jgi:hypothetical protein